MPVIGQFIRENDGFIGHLTTLSLHQDIIIVAAEPSDAENAPDYRVHVLDTMSNETGRSSGSRTAHPGLLPSAPKEISEPSNCPVRVRALADITSPISIDPESPMKSLAGWKLWGRNPAQAPARAALSRAPVVARVTPLRSESW